MRTAKVTVLPYDPAWQQDFERIKAELSKALGALAAAIEHVGSTSVPGLAAKPCIDIDVVVDDPGDLPKAIAALGAIGYIHEGDLGIAGREAFRYEGKTHLQRHHLYLCHKDSPELRRHITFRDHLRTNPEDAAEYSAVKLEAAALFPEYIDGYINHKSHCIAKIYKRCGLI